MTKWLVVGCEAEVLLLVLYLWTWFVCQFSWCLSSWSGTIASRSRNTIRVKIRVLPCIRGGRHLVGGRPGRYLVVRSAWVSQSVITSWSLVDHFFRKYRHDCNTSCFSLATRHCRLHLTVVWKFSLCYLWKNLNSGHFDTQDFRHERVVRTWHLLWIFASMTQILKVIFNLGEAISLIIQSWLEEVTFTLHGINLNWHGREIAFQLGN